MSILLILLGALLVGVALLDALWTTIAPRGAGPLSKRVARGWWSLSLWVHRSRKGGAHGLLAFAGPALLVVAFLTWVALLWTGWLFVFSAESGAVVASSSNEPASLAGRIYYVGFVLFTLGTGDYVPTGGAWEVLSAVASLSGLFVVTLAITYVLSVVSAVAAKRQLASSIHSLGSTPAEVVCRAWDGSRFGGLDQRLVAVSENLGMHTQRHLAYPVLHYFHSHERDTALGPNVAVFAEALLILAEGVEPGARPAPAVLEPARRTVRSFLETLSGAFISASADAPPAPDIAPAASVGVPTRATGRFEAAVEAEEYYRRLLQGLVEDSGWKWKDVVAPHAA